jgi:peptide-methionine (S)-S-oxide reductase
LNDGKLSLGIENGGHGQNTVAAIVREHFGPLGRLNVNGVMMMQVSNIWGLFLFGGWLFLSLCSPTYSADNPAASHERVKATFAGGCFWCMEPPFIQLPGVVSVTSGYTGGPEENPTYQQVSAGGTGHAEAVEIVYDPTQISYAQLLDIFWRNIDPLDASGQFCDKGQQYRTAIFYHSDEQQRLAEESKQVLKQSGRFQQPVVTAIVPASTFYPAEDYHQNYYQKNPIRYKYYRYSCGRDQRLEELWGLSK